MINRQIVVPNRRLTTASLRGVSCCRFCGQRVKLAWRGPRTPRGLGSPVSNAACAGCRSAQYSRSRGHGLRRGCGKPLGLPILQSTTTSTENAPLPAGTISRYAASPLSASDGNSAKPDIERCLGKQRLVRISMTASTNV